MYHTTGFTRDQIVELCVRVRQLDCDSEKPTWPPILGLYTSVVVVLTYLRRNRVQSELAETYAVSQPTISRAITAITPLLNEAAKEHVPVAEDLSARTQYIVDGTLLPCWSWAGHRELYSGKHKTTGLNVQVACELNGTLSWIPIPSMAPATTRSR